MSQRLSRSRLSISDRKTNHLPRTAWSFFPTPTRLPASRWMMTLNLKQHRLGRMSAAAPVPFPFFSTTESGTWPLPCRPYQHRLLPFAIPLILPPTTPPHRAAMPARPTPSPTTAPLSGRPRYPSPPSERKQQSSRLAASHGKSYTRYYCVFQSAKPTHTAAPPSNPAQSVLSSRRVSGLSILRRTTPTSRNLPRLVTYGQV